MFLKNAPILDDLEAGGFGFGRRFVVHDALLHPDHLGFLGDRLVDNGGHGASLAINVHNVDGFWNLTQTFIALVAEDLAEAGVHRNHLIALFL